MKNNNKKSYLAYLIITIAILVISVIAISFAYFNYDPNKPETLIDVSSSLECIDLVLSNDGTNVTLSHNYPISDELAMTSGSITPVTVTVTNNCSKDMKYTLALTSLKEIDGSNNYMSDNKIRYKITKNTADFKGIDYLNNLIKIKKDSKLFTNLVGTEEQVGEIARAYPDKDYVINNVYSIDDQITIGSNSTNTYQIYLWIDYYEGNSEMYESTGSVQDEKYNGSTEDKLFAAAISLTLNLGEKNEEDRLANSIIAQAPTGLKNNLESSMYRFKGDADNFICFGTSDKTECLNNPDAYMYRIIGITGENNASLGLEFGQLKLVKYQSIGNYSWGNNGSWENSSLYSTLQDNLFLNNTNYVPAGWSEKISSVKWNIGNVTSINSADSVYTNETLLQTNNASKIGLIHLSDILYINNTEYYNSFLSVVSGDRYWDYATMTSKSDDETWAIEECGDEYGFWHDIFANGKTNDFDYAVHPVFYLNEDELLAGGTGTSTDPFMLEGPKTSFAIYSADDNSFRFYKNDDYGTFATGDDYNGLTVTNIYTGFETETYEYNTVPWSDITDKVETVIVENEIMPNAIQNWFINFKNCFYFDLEKINTSKVTNLKQMFRMAGSKREESEKETNENWTYDDLEESFVIKGMDTWDLSNVTSLHGTFYYAGSKAQNFDIGNISNWNTSNVDTMKGAFQYAGFSAETIKIGDFSGWDTSNVTDMQNLFRGFANNSDKFVINLSNWNTSKVTNTSYMFYYAGQKATTWKIGDLSTKTVTKNGTRYKAWDMSNVTNIDYMFRDCATHASEFKLDLSNWNLKNIISLDSLFRSTALYASFELNLSNWNVSNVLAFNRMFEYTSAYNQTKFIVKGLNTWDTSSAINLSKMFEKAGSMAAQWEIGDLSNWTVSNVTNMDRMFYETGLNAPYSLNLTNWTVNANVTHTDFDTNVTTKVIDPIWP